MNDSVGEVYGLSVVVASAELAAPVLEYLPCDPGRYRPPIGLIGCGGISAHHPPAYRRAGYPVVALCDRNEVRARGKLPSTPTQSSTQRWQR